MNLRTRRRLIWAVALFLALGAVAIVVVGVGVPVKARVQETDVRSPRVRVSSTASADKPSLPEISLPELQQLCTIDLRKPLDSAASDQSDGAAAPASLTIRLIGTINEPGYSMAVFLRPDSTISVCGQGESVDDVGGPVTVSRIDQQKVTVRYAGRPFELLMPPPAP